MTNTIKRSYTATSRDEAWRIANDIFPTDYMQDARATENAGYPIYWSTAFGVNAWISDLNTSLELNMPDGQTIRIHIEEPEAWDFNGQY